MITCGAAGNIIVRDGTESFDLSTSNGYSNLVLRLTSPDEREHFSAKLFEVDDNLAGTDRAKAERYSEFLSDYAKRREAKLEEIQDLTAEQRRASISEFIRQLESNK